MALDQLVGSTAQNAPMYPGDPGGSGNIGLGLQPLPRTIRDHGAWLGDGIGSGGGLATLPEGHLRQVPFPRHFQPNFPRAHLPDPNMPRYMLGNLKTRMEGFGEQLGGFGETLGGYSGQFEKFGEQLGGLGEQMTGYQDALGSFNEQIGGMGKQFEAVNNKLDSLEKGIASLQQVQPQQQSYNPYASMMGMFNPYNRFSYGRRFG